jgi:ABC-2 type transport system ATP-binding protein
MTLVEVNGLSKSYGRIKAVRGLSFSIAAGEFVGLVGPNGAGKTTTIKMLAGQLFPTEGSVRIGGVGLDSPNELRACLGYVPEFPQLYDYLTGREMVEFVAEIRGGGDVPWALDLTGLGQDAERQICEYSQGMRRKTAIACAVVSRPKVLILDESLNGLDPPSVVRVLGVLDQVREEGAAVLLSTHVLDTLEKIATRVLMIQEGELKADLPADRLSEIRGMF